MARVERKDIPFTLCLLSNVYLKAVKSVSDVPIRTVLNAGVKVDQQLWSGVFWRYVLGITVWYRRFFLFHGRGMMGVTKSSIDCSLIEEDRKEVLWKGALACKEGYGSWNWDLNGGTARSDYISYQALWMYRPMARFLDFFLFHQWN